MRGNRALRVVKIAALVAVAVTVFGWVTMQLWNFVMPAEFGLKPLGFAQALALLVLSKILLGRFGPRGGGPPGWARRRMRRRWEAMSPEERERFRAGMRGRWGCGGGPASDAVGSGEQTVG